ILMPVIHQIRERSGLTQDQIGFTVSGSCDYLQGQPFAFVTALDAVGPWPPIDESHVEMDGAWALYEAWVRLQYGDVDTAHVSPRRKHDCPPITDGAAAVVLAAGDKARQITDRPAWIRGIDHRIEPHSLGVRDLTDSPSTRRAAEKAGVADGSVDVAELHAP